MYRTRSNLAVDLHGIGVTQRPVSPILRSTPSPSVQTVDLYDAGKVVDQFNIKTLKRYWLGLIHLTTGTSKTWARSARIIVPVALICLVLLVAYLSLPGTQADELQYAVFIDAGSSGSRLHVYRYTPQRWPHYAVISPQQDVLKVEPGLSRYAGRPGQAAESLQPLLDFAHSKVPPSAWPSTPVLLMATAGLRLLPRHQAEAILAACRQALAASAFLFHPSWAELISGDMEGLYGWLAVNYATGALQDAARQLHGGRPNVRRPDSFQGVLEMGGASMQITFMPQPGCTPHQYAYHLRLPGLQGLLVTHSYLGAGLDTARANVSDMLRRANASSDPCMPAGHVAADGLVGSGNYSQCYQLVSQLFHADKGAAQQQAEQHAQQRPPSRSVPCLSGRFLGIENFHWTARALGLPPLASVEDMEGAAAAHCGSSAHELRRQHPPEVEEQHMLRYCFGATYIVALLDQGIGFQRRRHQLVFTNEVARPDGGRLELDWALGALLTHLMQHTGYSLYAFKGAGSGHGAGAERSSSSSRGGSGSPLGELAHQDG